VSLLSPYKCIAVPFRRDRLASCLCCHLMPLFGAPRSLARPASTPSIEQSQDATPIASTLQQLAPESAIISQSTDVTGASSQGGLRGMLSGMLQDK
jgi:hypothetical protein